MDKKEYVCKQLARAVSKKYENYVVTRIWHLLDDMDIKFVTQQHVTRLDKGRALTDMFFPQLEFHIEVDEPQHENEKHKNLDKIREVDIINATGHEIKRITIKDKSLEEINTQIDKLVSYIKTKKEESKEFKPWDMKKEQNPQTYINKGSIELKDYCAFNRIVDCINCFGKEYKTWRRGGVPHPKEKDTLIWCPKFYENEGWENSISEDEKEIREISTKPEIIKNHIDNQLNSEDYRIVFARVKNNLGEIMYRFKGKYKINREKTNYTEGVLWERVSECVKTYSSQLQQ